ASRASARSDLPRRRSVASRRAVPSNAQSIDEAAIDQMRVDDLVDVMAVHVRVPDRFRVDDDAGTFVAAIQAAGLVDAHLAGAAQAKRLDTFLGVLLHFGRVMTSAAGGAFLALVQAEKHVVLVVAHARSLISGL